MNHILAVQNLSKTYQSGEKSLTVLSDINFEIEPGSSCAIIGPSGSGKMPLWDLFFKVSIYCLHLPH